jgi:hypothetical protein
VTLALPTASRSWLQCHHLMTCLDACKHVAQLLLALLSAKRVLLHDLSCCLQAVGSAVSCFLSAKRALLQVTVLMSHVLDASETDTLPVRFLRAQPA